MLVIFLFAIDATIVSTAMPTIVGRLGGLELYGWVFSIYMLTSALATPLFGKLADLFGRRNLMLAGIGVFVIGSTLCGAAQSMEMLVAFRAIQGVGGGAIYALAFIIVGIIYTAEMRAKMQGIISSIWGLASILGPLAGGLIVEHTTWRWAFFVNIPITAVAILLILAGLGEETAQRRAPKLDWRGAATLLLALLLLFYALARSAHSAEALNVKSAGLIALAMAILAVFISIERRAEEPLIPSDLFQLKLFRTCAAVATLASMGVFGAVSYLPLYLQGVLGFSASQAGVVLLVLSLAWTAGSLLAGPWINRHGYRTVTATGMSLLAIGFGLFFFVSETARILFVFASGIAIGIGMGLANLTTLVAAQSGVWPRRIGVATSTIMLFRTFGGAFSVSLMGTVLLNRMQQGLSRLDLSGTETMAPGLRHKLAHPQNLLEPSTRALVPPDLLPSLIELLADAIWYAFLTVFVLMLIGVAVSLRMSSDTPATTPKPGTPSADQGSAVQG